MELLLSPPPRVTPLHRQHPRHRAGLAFRSRSNRIHGGTEMNRRPNVAVIDGISAAAADPPAGADVTWQIVVGAVAGVTPFVVAGIEFSKRIVAQRRCQVCGGSGLVLEEKEYFRCPGCGGFLPWQSWK